MLALPMARALGVIAVIVPGGRLLKMVVLWGMSRVVPIPAAGAARVHRAAGAGWRVRFRGLPVGHAGAGHRWRDGLRAGGRGGDLDAADAAAARGQRPAAARRGSVPPRRAAASM
jgi:hypothetical protein